MTYQYPHHLLKQVFSLIASGWKFARFAAAAMGLLLLSPCAQAENLVSSALKFFLGNDSNTPGFDLDKSRPKPVAQDLKAVILASLPREGLVQKLPEPLRRKLDSLEPVLHVQQRESVYEVRIFETEPKMFAFVGLHARAVLLISDAALSLLTAEELQAAVAHEIGHEYVWAEYLEAAKRQDNQRLKELELYCDGVAILTLRQAGQAPAALLTATKKIANFNRMNTGPAANIERYPSADERRRFALAVVNWADSHGDQSGAGK